MHLLKENHPTKDLKDFIKAIIETKSKEEEDNIIRRGIESLKTGIAQKSPSNAKMIEYCLRAVYSDMLGHNVNFSHVFAIKLIENKNLHVKRIGYLSSTLLLPQDSDLKILIVASLQRDLGSKNDLEVLCALNALNKLANESLAQAFAPSLMPLVDHKNAFIRKKVFIAMQKIEHIAPGSIPIFVDKVKQALLDPDFSVVNAAVGAILEEAAIHKELYASALKPLAHILKQVIEKKMMYYDYQKIPEPYLQIKILKIFALLAAKDKAASEEVYPVVEKCLGRSDNLNTDVSYALVYENILTICALYYNKPLLDLASAAVAKFLNPALSNSNMILLGITALSHITQIDPNYLEDHQAFVINCIESPDDTIKRITLDLLCKNASPVNIETITNRLSNNLLTTTDIGFKKELTRKIFDLAILQASDVTWFVRKIHELLGTSADLFSPDMLVSGIKIFQEHLEDSEEIASILVDESTRMMGSATPHDSVVKLAAWVFGYVGPRVRHTSEELGELFKSLVGMMSLKLTEEDTKLWILDSIQIVSKNTAFRNQDELEAFLDWVPPSACLEVPRKVAEIRNGAFYRSLLDYQQPDFDSKLTFLLEFTNKKKGKFYNPETSERINGLRQTKAGFGELKLRNEEPQIPSAMSGLGGSEDARLEGVVKNPKWSMTGYHGEKDEAKVHPSPKKFDMFADMDKKPTRKQAPESAKQAINKKDMQLFAKSNETGLFGKSTAARETPNPTDRPNPNPPMTTPAPWFELDMLEGNGTGPTHQPPTSANQGVDFFDSASTQAPVFAPSPIRITEEQYQEYWEAFGQEKKGTVDIQGSVTKFLSQKKFSLVSEDEDDYITAAQSGQEVLLLYLARLSGNRFEYIVKAKSADTTAALFEYIRR
jgi:AP-4 complex subunit epsilon-1